jgi:hypothetical protein
LLQPWECWFPEILNSVGVGQLLQSSSGVLSLSQGWKPWAEIGKRLWRSTLCKAQRYNDPTFQRSTLHRLCTKSAFLALPPDMRRGSASPFGSFCEWAMPLVRALPTRFYAPKSEPGAKPAHRVFVQNATSKDPTIQRSRHSTRYLLLL